MIIQNTAEYWRRQTQTYLNHFSVQDLEEKLKKAWGDLKGLEMKVLNAKQKEREKKEAKYSELT